MNDCWVIAKSEGLGDNMDNRPVSQITRGLKLTISYGIVLVLFQVFLVPVISLAKDNIVGFMPYLSFAIFLMLFFSVYVEMRILAFKEKRPQYHINPSPYKGFLYGVIGIIPLVIIQTVLMLIRVPEDFAILKRRAYQAFSGPLYWFSKLLGNEPIHYVLSFLLVVLMAGLGYYAGHKDFLITELIRQKLGIKKKVKK